MKMLLNVYLYTIYITLYFNRNDYAMANPMIGPSVTHVKRHEFPFIVALTKLRTAEQTDATVYHICTGSLITRQDVLIAAHCFHGENPSSAEIRVGSINLNKSNRYALLWWLNFNEWTAYVQIRRRFLDNDIGNIRLQQRVPSNVRLGVLSSLPTVEHYHNEVVIAGWGSNEQNQIPEFMRKAKLRVLDLHDCSRIISQLNGTLIHLHERFICTNANPYVIMHWGDSGAPVILDGEIIAVHKATMPFLGDFHNPNKINIHTTINYYRNFVDSVIDPQFQWL